MATAPWQEMADSPKEQYSQDGFRATRKILTAWSDRTTIANELMGSLSPFGTTGNIPYPGLTSVRCTRVAIEPLTDDVISQAMTALDSDLNQFDSFAVLTASYETIDPKDKDLEDGEITPIEGTYFTYRLSIASSVLIIPNTGIKWTSDAPGKAPQEADLTFTRQIPLQEHHLMWHRVLDPPRLTWRTLIGTVNDALYLNAAPGTLLFTGATMEKEFAFSGNFDDVRPAYKCTLTFKERRIMDGGAAIGWNYAWRSLPAGSQGWQEMSDINGNPLYTSSNFLRLTEAVDPGA